MEKTWVLVAESSQARIFTADSPSSPLNEIETLSHQNSREHAQNLSTDLPGRQADKSSPSHHSLSDSTDLKKQEAMKFAKIINDHLDKGRNQQAYQNLIIVADPAFLGLLRENQSSATSKLVSLEVNKNLGKESLESIRQHLPEILPGKSLTSS